MYHSIRVFILNILLLSFILPYTLNAYDQTQAENWLTGHINTTQLTENKSDIALSIQSSRESILALHQRDAFSSLDTNSILQPFLNSDENTTEYLVSKIIVSHFLGYETAPLVDKLQTMQNSNGGFGHTKGSQSTALDTALALEAMSLSTTSSSIASVLSYLTSLQKTDGSWSDFSTNIPSYTTALAMRALWMQRKSFDVNTNLESAKTYLASKPINDETFINALVLRSIAPLYYSKSELTDRIDNLKAQHLGDGSFDTDPYITALALQALYLADREVPNPDLATLSGLVVDGDSGIALSNITIELEGISTIATDGDGRFAFSGLQNDSYTLHITSSNYAPLHTIVRMVGDDVNLGTLRLNKNTNATISTIKGVVKDQQSGELLSGVTVTVGDSETVTDSSGSYIIDSIEAGSYTLVLQKTGYIQKRQNINVPANTLFYYNATLDIIDLTVEATIEGSIVDKNTSALLEGVLVELTGSTIKSITTTSDGRFVFSSVGQGEYDIKITKEGYRTQVATVQIDQSRVIDFGIIALETADPTVTTVTIKGVVTEAQTHIPLQGALIAVGANTTHSDSNGNYELTDLSAGLLNIEVSKDGYNAVSAQANAVAGSVISFLPTLQKVDASLSIYGTIFDANSSEPLADVQVTYSGEHNSTVFTDEQGYYLISPVSQGGAILSYSKFDYDSVAFSVEVGDSSLNISPTLKPLEKDKPDNNAIISGIVMDSTTNEVLSGVAIHITGAFTDESIVSDVDGSFRIEGIKSYDVNISFIQNEYKSVETSVWLQRDENLDMGQVRMRPLSADVLLPDLSMVDINVSGIHIEQDKLDLNGTIAIEVTNKGKIKTESSFSILAYYDVNRDGNYSESIDSILGESSTSTILDIDDNVTVNIVIEGELPYVNAPISLWIDSKTQIIELDEENNVMDSSDRCTVTKIGQFNPVIKWHWDGKKSAVPNSYNPYSAPIVVPVDSNKDGKIDETDDVNVIFQTHITRKPMSNNIVLRSINGKDGSIVWSNIDSRLHYSSDIASGDIDGDGNIEIVGLTYDKHIRAFEDDGRLKWQSDWVADCWGSVALSDLDSDGKVEIIIGNSVLDAQGKLLWSGNGYSGIERFEHGTSIVVDLNADGINEIVAGPSAYDSNGIKLWQTNIGDGYTAIGDFLANGLPEIVLVSKGRIYLLDNLGKIIWGPVYFPGGGYSGAPTVADVDGDGEPEIGVAGGDYYVIFETDGSIKWKSPTYDHSSSITGSSVFDFEGDGKAEVIYADERYLRIYNGENGNILYELENSSGTAKEIPIIVDADKDGHADIIFISNNYSTQTSYGIKMISDINNSWMPTRSIWNQHSYHISNINDDGTIPRVEEPSWLTHNTYRLNTFADRDPRSAPDLSISLLSLNESEDTNLTLFVRVGSGGSDKLRGTTKVSFYDGNPTNGGTLIGSQELTSLDKGEYIDITLDNISIPVNGRIYAVVDPEDKISECDETNNRMDISVTASKLAGKITVSTDAPTYTVNQLAHLSATSTNLGKLEANLTAQLTLEDTQGNTLQTFPSVDLGIVASQESRTISSEWNTTTTLAGEYILKGILTDSNGNVVDESSTSFNIISDNVDGVSATLDTSTDRLRYHTTDSVNISNFIQSLSSNSIITNAKVVLEIVDANSIVVQPQTLQLGELLPLATKESEYQYNYVRLATGNYTVNASLYGNDNRLFATDTAVFEVYEDLSKGIKGSVEVAWYSDVVGTAQECSYSVTNFGSTALNELPLELRVLDLNNSMIKETFPTTVDINSTQTIHKTENFDTNGYTASDYSCALYMQVENAWLLVDHKPFILTLPPILIGGSLTQEGKGRILILLDPCKYTDESNSSQLDCTEPFGSSDAIDLPLQRSYLETLLTYNGYSYTIVTDAQSFTTELRSGAYSLYALLDETVKLTKSVQKELREAVFKGEGLLVSGTHDSRNHFVYETMGVKYVGHYSQANGTEVTESSYSPFKATLLSKSQPVRFTSDETASLASYAFEESDQREKAVVKYAFGKGESIFVGYDILAHASTYQQGAYGNFLLEILSSLYRHTDEFGKGSIIPMTLHIENQGIATPLRADLSTTPNANFVDAIDAKEFNATALSFEEELFEESGQRDYRFWLQALEASSYIELTADIFSLLNGEELQQAHFDYSILVGSSEDVETLVISLSQVELTDKKDKQELDQAIRDIEKAKKYLQEPDLEKALSALISSTDALQKIEAKEAVKDSRVMIDNIIRETEIQMNKVGE